VLKFFLHVSKGEQRKRFLERLESPEKHWKFSASDLAEREHWDDYQHAYEEMLRKCSTKTAPWYVVPANKKWYRNLVVATILVEALEGLEIQSPEPEEDLKDVVIE